MILLHNQKSKINKQNKRDKNMSGVSIINKWRDKEAKPGARNNNNNKKNEFEIKFHIFKKANETSINKRLLAI